MATLKAAAKKAVAKIKKANINFKRLSLAGKRRAIYADIIATLKKPAGKRFKVKQKVYFKLRKAAGIRTDASLQALLPKVEPNCTVCGIGACFISHVRLANEFKVSGLCDTGLYDTENGKIKRGVTPYADDAEMIPVMEKYFTVSDLRRIEAAFEGTFYSYWDYSDEECSAAKQWVKIIPNATARLRAIAENGLRNKGNFKILQLPSKPRTTKKSTKKASARRGR